MKILQGIIKAEPGYEDQMRDSLKKLMKPSREEKGVLSYNMYERIEQPGTFILLVTFQDQEAFDQHIASDHSKAYFTENPESTFSGELYFLNEIS